MCLFNAPRYRLISCILFVICVNVALSANLRLTSVSSVEETENHNSSIADGKFLAVDKCASNPCMNGGECISYANGYRCVCLRRYTGFDCDKVNYCLNTPCKGRGFCRLTETEYVCECHEQYGGENCEKDCSKDCGTGKCLFVDGEQVCKCKTDSKLVDGTCKRCSKKCGYGGECLYKENEEICHCKFNAKLVGGVCKRQNCKSNPCKNDGACTQDGYDFTCFCQPDFEGRYCENKKDLMV